MSTVFTNDIDQRGSMPDKQDVTWWIVLRAILAGLVFVLAVSGILIFEFLPVDRIILDEGDVSDSDIRAPREITYVSQILTKEAKDRAAAAVSDIYDPPDVRVARQQLTKVRQILDYMDSVRQDSYATPEQQQQWIEAIPDLSLPVAVIDQILSLSEGNWQAVQAEAISVVDEAMSEEIRESQLDQAKRRVSTLVGLELSEVQAGIVSELARGLIKPNSFYNAEKTDEAKQLARESVTPASRTIVEGEIILRAGDIVTSLDVEALSALGLRQAETEWQEVVSNVVFVLLITIVLGLYLARFQQEYWRRWPRMFLLILLLVLFILMAKLMVSDQATRSYLLPTAALSMLLTVLLGPQLAITVTVLFSIVVGFMAGGSLELAVYALIGGLLASLSLRRVEKLNAFFWAGVYVALANLVVILAFRLPKQDYDAVQLLTLASLSLVNGGLSASLTVAGFYLLGTLFDITTSLQLMELARPTHPLLRELMLKAPGTYHHSILVSNMSEEAAGRVGADALLARVGAYYHDVGKITRPYFFIDNQMGGLNVHDRLDARTSAEIIISHVTDGLDLAKKHRLPSKVRDFIAQHHGTSLATYFYRQALESDGDEVNEEDFRYPGPKPQTKETAIVMLADNCEAAVRGERPESLEGIEELIRKIIGSKMLDGQLDECDLTLRDLDKIRAAFVKILQGVFHPRVKYPEEAKVEGNNEGANSE
ncbi:MAG: HDIG domain-containing protein [Anaerolineales bacterium]|nr:HDIG domain-containing protein [Anaerolineales bacterium]